VGRLFFGYPKASPRSIRTMGMWGFLVPGFCQFLTGVLSLVIYLVQRFRKCGTLYMAGLAFTVYGIHWFAMAHRRYTGSSAARMDGGDRLSLSFRPWAFVFGKAGDVPVIDHFIGLADLSRGSPTRLAGWNAAHGCSAAPCLTGIWLDVLHVGSHRESAAGSSSGLPASRGKQFR